MLQIVKNEKIANWLDECRTLNTRHAYSYAMANFFDWYNDTPESFLALSSDKKRHVALRYQNEKKGILANNTVLMTMGTLNSFLDVYDQKINFKGKRVSPQMDMSSHNLTDGDLKKIFEIGNVKEKSFISLMASTGWEVGAVLGLKRKKLEQLVAKAKFDNENFVYFFDQRKKTNAVRLGIINPLALKWLALWLIESKNIPLKKRDPNRHKKHVESDIFDIGVSGANQMLKGLIKKANVKTTGRIHLHIIRKWVMGSLIVGGMSEFEVKFIVGKKIPLSDFTYLKTLEIGIKDKYPRIFENYLNLETSSKAVVDLSKSLEQKDQELKSQKTQLEQLQKKYDNLHLEKLLDRLQQLEKKLENKN